MITSWDKKSVCNFNRLVDEKDIGEIFDIPEDKVRQLAYCKCGFPKPAYYIPGRNLWSLRGVHRFLRRLFFRKYG